jgi:hypothetical protein
MSDQNIVKGTYIDQLIQLISSSNSSNDNLRLAFFYAPPGDYQIYHITFEWLKENIYPDSDHTFYYKLDDNGFYQVSCRLISHSLIVIAYSKL